MGILHIKDTVLPVGHKFASIRGIRVSSFTFAFPKLLVLALPDLENSTMCKPILSILFLSFLTGHLPVSGATPGLVQSRFVEPGQLIAPTGISVSPEGVAYVSCDPNGTTNQKSKAGKVVRCEDTNGDGVADLFTNFVEGIDSPRGSCYVGDTLYLMLAPYLAAYQDKDGDGVADKVTLLVTNLGQPLGDDGVFHGPNGVRMGIDGWLYLAVGDQGVYRAKGMDGSEATLHGGGVFRVRPDGRQLEVLLTGTRNLYDVAASPYLDLFARDNTNDGGGWGTRLHHLTELANYGYPQLYKNFSHEAMPPLADYGAGAGTGMYYLHEPGFPEGLGATLYSGDFNKGVFTHTLKPEGGSFGVGQEPFLELPKNTGIDVDGSSRMYFASWQGGGFGFASRAFGHVDLVQTQDRTGAAKYPNIRKASDKDLLTHLASTSQVTRINAMREMVTRGKKGIFSKDLLELAKDAESTLFARAAAVMTLKQLDGMKSHHALSSLYGDEGVREFIVRALGDVSSEIDGTSKKVLLQALKDENPRVRIRAVVGLSRSGDVTVAEEILPLANGEKMLPIEGHTSSPLSHTALKAVVKLGAVEMLLRKLDDPNLREAALRGLQEIHSEKVVKGLAGKVQTTKDKSLAKLVLLTLFRLYHQEEPWDGKSWWKHRPNFTGPYYRSTEWEHTPAVREAIRISFNQVDSSEYADLFIQMRGNQVPEEGLTLDIHFDEALALLEKETLTTAEYNRVMAAVNDPERPAEEQLVIYNYFKSAPLPDSYLNRAHILRLWGEGRAEHELHRKAYADFVSGKEFIGRLEDLAPFFKESNKDCYKYAHLQILRLINNPATPKATHEAAKAEMEKTWADAKNIYRPYRLRGLMLAFEEADPTPYEKELKPLVEHRDERTKQGAARYLGQIKGGGE